MTIAGYTAAEDDRVAIIVAEMEKLNPYSPVKKRHDLQNGRRCMVPGDGIYFGYGSLLFRGHCRATGLSFCHTHCSIRTDAPAIWRRANRPLPMCIFAYERLLKLEQERPERERQACTVMLSFNRAGGAAAFWNRSEHQRILRFLYPPWMIDREARLL